MRRIKFLLTATAAFASAVSATGVARAADVMASEQIENWTGIYAGAWAGVATLNQDWTMPDEPYGVQVDNYAFFDGIMNNETQIGGDDITFFGGATLGGRWQFGHGLVVGIAGDYGIGKLEAEGDIYKLVPDAGTWCNISAGCPGYATGTTELTSLMTARATLGIPIGDRFLLNFSAGLASGQVKARMNDDYITSELMMNRVYTLDMDSEEEFMMGYAAGAGAEYKITEHVSVMAEALFYDLGDITTKAVEVSGTDAPGGDVDMPAGTTYSEYEDSVTGIVAKAGLNFNF